MNNTSPRPSPALFRMMLERALEIDPDEREEIRLANLISQQRAQWLLERGDDLILDFDAASGAGEGAER